MLSEPELIPYHASELTGRKALVVAPHPDDETFGCGGAIRIHIEAGDPVKTVFLTNGAKGDTKAVHDRATYISLRRDEARRACRNLGVTDLEFWNYEDRELANQPGIIHRLVTLIQDFRPNLVYAPSPYELHPDHRATAGWIWEAAAQADIVFEIAFYEVSSPVPVNCLVDISRVMTQKVAAIDSYESQLKERRYKETCLGLNAFRTLTLPSQVTHAEGFLLLSSLDAKQATLAIISVNRCRRFVADLPGVRRSVQEKEGETASITPSSQQGPNRFRKILTGMDESKEQPFLDLFKEMLQYCENAFSLELFQARPPVPFRERVSKHAKICYKALAAFWYRLQERSSK